MNVLLFVMTLLMLLSIMTYARIESFRDLSALKGQFEWYMQKNERKYPNEITDKKYNEENPSKKKKGIDPDTKQEDEEKACSKLSLYLLFNKKQRELKQAVFQQHYDLAKFLMEQLYEEANFFKEAEENHPDLPHAILDSLISSADHLPDGHTITSASDLASIDLGDALLNEVFYRMLKGTVYIEGQDKDETYPSFIKYLTVKNKSKIRIYLASKELLLAIYNDPNVVENILSERYALYQQVDEDEISKEEATKEFQSEFSGQQRPEIEDSILDFKVTKTNPKRYE